MEQHEFEIEIGPDGKVKVDGALDEAFWKPDKAVEKLVGGAFDNRATFDAVWDGHSLHIAFRVLDDDVRTESKKPWNNDSVEVFLDYRNDRETAYNADDRRIVVDAAGRIHVVGLARRIQWSAKRFDGGHAAEIAVSPWNMGGYDSFKGRVIGLDVACNDSDSAGKRDGRVVWRGTQDNETDPSGLGTALFPEK